VGQLKTAAQEKKKLDEDQELINTVRKAISVGITSKSAIVKNVGDETGVPQNKIRKTLAARTGNAYDFGHRWSVITGAHNKSEYSLLDPFNSAEEVND